MTTLNEATLALARVLGDVFSGVADTGGSTTTLIDERLTDKAGSLQNGTLWFLSGDLDGVCARVEKHSAGKLTFPAQGIVPDGLRYAVAKPQFPKHLLEQAMGLALGELPEHTLEDITLVTVANQEEYTLPTGVANLVSVEIATAAADPYSWVESLHWRETAGGKLRFISGWQPGLAGNKMRLSYNDKHPRLPHDDLDTDKQLRDADDGDLDADEHAEDWIDYSAADRFPLIYVVTVPEAVADKTLDIKIQTSANGVDVEDEFVFPQISEAGRYLISFRNQYQYRRHYSTVGGVGPDFGEVLIGPLTADTLSVGVKLARLKWEAAIFVYRTHIETVRSTSGDDPIEGLMGEAKIEADTSPRHKMKRIGRAPILAGW